MAGSGRAGFKFTHSDFRVHALNCCAIPKYCLSPWGFCTHHFLYLEGSLLHLYLLPGTFTQTLAPLGFQLSDLPSQGGHHLPTPLDSPYNLSQHLLPFISYYGAFFICIRGCQTKFFSPLVYIGTVCFSPEPSISNR